MSDLVKQIRAIQGLRVGNAEHFNQYYLNELMESSHVSKEESHLYLDSHPKNKYNIIIGGYGDVNSAYGAGHTRILPKASYTLHMFATKSDAELYQYSKSEADSGSVKLTEDIRMIQSFMQDFAKDIGHVSQKPVIEDAQLFVANAEGNSIYAEGIITNVHKKDLFYRGDITLHFMKQIGCGARYMNDRIETHKSLKTDAMLFGESSTGLDFRDKVQSIMGDMSRIAQESKLMYDATNWLLLVSNE
jgi:hypothetical protein